MKSLKLYASTLLLSMLLVNPLFCQNQDKSASQKVLESEISAMDSLLFNVAFNQCDLNLFEKILSRDIEFYDDRSGLNTSYEKEIAAFKDKCSKPVSVSRKLINSSVHVLGEYGAVQTGKHAFYVDGKKVEEAKFITVWERKEKSWIVKRVISYDHVGI